MLTFEAPGGASTQSVRVASGTPVDFTVSVDVGWISVTPTSATAVPGGTNLTVTVSPGSLPAGVHRANISIEPAGGVPVTVLAFLKIGSATPPFSATPSSLSFSYQAGGAPPQATVQLQGGGEYLAAVFQEISWLRISRAGQNPHVFLSGTLPDTLQISADSAALASLGSGNYTARIDFTGSGQATLGSVSVALSVTGGGANVTVTPVSLAFSGPVEVAPDPKTIDIGAAVAGVFYTADASHPWISLSQFEGEVPVDGTSISVAVNPAGLPAATYTGHIDFNFTGAVTYFQRVAVTYAAGGAGPGQPVLTGPVAPLELSFAMQTGSAAGLGAQEIVVTGPVGENFSAASSGAGWLNVSLSSSVLPGKVTVSIDEAAGSALAVGQHQGAVLVETGEASVEVPVRLNVFAGPVLRVVPASAAVYYQPGVTPAPRPILFSLTGSAQPLDFTILNARPTLWLQAVKAVGTIFASVNVAALAPGIHTATIPVSAAGAANAMAEIPVTVVVGDGQGGLVSPASLSFTTPSGGAPDPKTVMVNAAFTATPSSTATWLSVSPASATGPASLKISINSNSLAPGVYRGHIAVVSNGLSRQVPVTLTVTSAVAADLKVGQIAPFEYMVGSAVPAARILQVGSTGGSLTYTTAAASQGDWLLVSPASGHTPAELKVSLAPQSLPPGTYTGTITVSAPGTAAQTRTVTLTVRPALGLTAAPASLSFTYRIGGAIPGAQAVNVQSSGSPIQYNATSNVPWIAIGQPAGLTPGAVSIRVMPDGLEPGEHAGQVIVAAAPATPANAAAIRVNLTVASQLPTVTSLLHAATNSPGHIAPGQMVTLSGTSMGPARVVEAKPDAAGRMPTVLSDVRILFNGMPAPLLRVGAGRASAVAPYSLAGRTSATVWLEYRGVRSNAMTLQVAPACPGVFTADSSGSGPGAILNADNGPNSDSNPAARGSVVTLYLTGEGQTQPGGVDGLVHGELDDNNLPVPVLPVTVAIDGQPADIVYAGAAPKMVSGLMQLNVEVPAKARSGAVPVVVTVGGASSRQDVTIAVR